MGVIKLVKRIFMRILALLEYVIYTIIIAEAEKLKSVKT
jgi:hypothetical protein